MLTGVKLLNWRQYLLFSDLTSEEGVLWLSRGREEDSNIYSSSFKVADSVLQWVTSNIDS